MNLFIPLLLTIALTATDLEKRNLLDGRIEMLVPTNFRWMTESELAIKYAQTARAPKLVLTDEKLEVNLAFSHTSTPVDDNTLPMMQKAMRDHMAQAYPAAEWKGDGIKEINGKKFGYVKLIVERGDKTYNYVLFTELDGRLLILSFNCAEKLISEWEPISEQLMASIVVH